MTILPSQITINADQQCISIRTFSANDTNESLNHTVQVIASGPSIRSINFDDELTSIPTFFVNGSISLTGQYDFSHIAGWVISDARFVAHQPDMFISYYSGQPLYATAAVFEALARVHPHVLHQYHDQMRVIFSVDRPWRVKSSRSWYRRLLIPSKKLRQKIPLHTFKDHPNFIIDTTHKPAPIGVSLDVTDGFVEAGTVAYVATQLAFSKKATSIHLYGVDLINSDQPRFYESRDNSAPCKLDKAVIDRIVPSFDLLACEYQKYGVSVYNHSIVSKNFFSFIVSI